MQNPHSKIKRRKKEIIIREFKSEDLPAVISLLSRCFPITHITHTMDWWNWKHNDNVFGRSIVLVAEENGRIVGLRGFWRWDFLYQGEALKAVQSVDTCVDPEFRRRGIFTQLILAALEMAKLQGIQIVYNFPVKLSLPGYMKLGWRYVKRVGWYIRPLRPLTMLSRCLKQSDKVRCLLETQSLITEADIERLRLLPVTSRISTRASHRFLRWRYIENPLFEYGIIRPPEGQQHNTGIYRFNICRGLRELRLVDIINFDEGSFVPLIRRVISTARSLQADYILIPELGISGIRSSMARQGFLLAPRKGFNFVCRPSNLSVNELFFEYGNWFVTPGNVDTY